MFEKMKQGYLEYGYDDESYITFLRVTYKRTDINFPETIEAELNEV